MTPAAVAMRLLPAAVLVALLSSCALVSCAPVSGSNVTSNSSDPLPAALEAFQKALGNGSLNAQGVLQFLNACGGKVAVPSALTVIAGNSSADQWPASIPELILKIQKTFNVTSPDILAWVSLVLQSCTPKNQTSSGVSPSASQSPSGASVSAGHSPSAASPPGGQKPGGSSPSAGQKPNRKGQKESGEDEAPGRGMQPKKDDKDSKKDAPMKGQKAPRRKG